MDCNNCGAALDAANQIKKEKRAHELKRLAIICGSMFLCVVAVCASVLGCIAIKEQQNTILEQQYALNMQYSGLLDLLSRIEVTTVQESEADGDGSIAISGDNNITAGGDVTNGEQSENN